MGFSTRLFSLSILTLCLQASQEIAIPGMPPQDIGIGSGIGWANASGIIGGDVGQVISTAVSSADSSVINTPNGPIVTGNGNGEGISIGWVNSTNVPNPGQPSNSAASIDLTGNGGGTGTSIIIGNNSQQVFKRLMSLLPKHPPVNK